MLTRRFESYNSLVKHKKRLHAENKIKHECLACNKVNECKSSLSFGFNNMFV